MCLIAYVPAGKSLPLINMRAAHFANDDGIGIMSKEGICKFLGKKALKKAIKTVAQLEEAKIEYAIHFRYKTHGDVILQNCHPFKTPNGAAYVMHNGVLSANGYTAKATKEFSDTAVFVKEYLTEVPDDNNIDFWSEVARHIGWNNKLCVMTHDFRFILVHGEAGTYRDGIWYSQTYSLPHEAYKGTWQGAASAGVYNSSPRSNVWPYHLENCTCRTCVDAAIDDAQKSGDTKRNNDYWVNRHPEWYVKLKDKQKIDKGRVPTSIVTESLRQALDRRYGTGGVRDPRMIGGQRTVSEPLRLTHTSLQSLAAAIPGVEDSRETQMARDEDRQLDSALQRHLARMDDEAGYAELEIDVSTKGDTSLPGWSEVSNGSE